MTRARAGKDARVFVLRVRPREVNRTKPRSLMGQKWGQAEATHPSAQRGQATPGEILHRGQDEAQEAGEVFGLSRGHESIHL